MGISRSGEPATWVASASIFSGRPDPVWQVAPELGERLAELWDGLPAWAGDVPRPPPLGYRGCRLEAPDGRVWTAYGQLISLDGQRRRDAEKEFERTLIGSAPPGLLPATAGLSPEEA
jgi:hypothetical protein